LENFDATELPISTSEQLKSLIHILQVNKALKRFGVPVISEQLKYEDFGRENPCENGKDEVVGGGEEADSGDDDADDDDEKEDADCQQAEGIFELFQNLPSGLTDIIIPPCSAGESGFFYLFLTDFAQFLDYIRELLHLHQPLLQQPPVFYQFFWHCRDPGSHDHRY